MRVAHVVTYVSPDGAFGGPVRVALGQAEALAELGHEVTVYAGAPAHLAGVTRQDGYTLKTYPARRVFPLGGWASVAAPALARSLRDDAANLDVAHVHLARDLVTMPAVRRIRKLGIPYLVQPHGMIDDSANPLANALDIVATRNLLRNAARVLTLTDSEAQALARIEPAARTHEIINGIRIADVPPYEGRENLVLFLARMVARKRPIAFVEMARHLHRSFPDTRFLLAGPDEGEGDAVRAAIAESGMGDLLEWIGPVSPDDTDELLTSARAYVLPAVDEVFPMSILESFRVGTPVVTTDSLGIAADCVRYSAAVITDGSPEQLAKAVAGVLESDHEAVRLRDGGLAYLREELDITRVASVLETLYGEAARGKS